MNTAEWWKAANEAFERGEPEAALRALDALLATEPGHGQALNFAGWLRTRGGAGDRPPAFELGLRQLQQALASGDPDPRIPVNFGDAMARDGRGPEAVPALREWLTRHPKAGVVWNSLGWLLGVVGEELGEAAKALEKATSLSRGLGAGHLNLAKVHLKAKRYEAAANALTWAIQARVPFRVHEAWLLLGEVHRVRGHLRRALGAYRRAYELDGELRPQLQPLIAGVGGALVAERRYFLNAVEDSLRAQAFEAWESPSVQLPIPLAELHRRAEAARFRLPVAAHGALAVIERVCAAGELLPEFADRSPVLELAPHGAEDALLRDWRDAQSALYDDLLVLEEALPELAGTNAIHLAVARRDWAGASEALRAYLPHREPEPDTEAAFAELIGDAAWRFGEVEAAQRSWKQALGAAQQFASWSSSGGEGLARMVAVDRLKAKLASREEAPATSRLPR